MSHRAGSVFARALKQILPDGDIAQLQALDHWLWGEPELRLVRRLCSRSMTAIDVGANIGTYTHYMRKHARAVSAYEPNPILASRLQRLYPDVRVRNVAVSEAGSRVVLRIPMAGNIAIHALASISQRFEGDSPRCQYDVRHRPSRV